MQTLLWIQGAYFFVTGIWPLLHYRSFEQLTGPKTDVWLVKTVGTLVAVTGIVFIESARSGNFSSSIVVLSAGSALGLLLIDVVFVFKKVISRIYLLDALVELLFLAGICLLQFLPGWE